MTHDTLTGDAPPAPEGCLGLVLAYMALIALILGALAVLGFRFP